MSDLPEDKKNLPSVVATEHDAKDPLIFSDQPEDFWILNPKEVLYCHREDTKATIYPYEVTKRIVIELKNGKSLKIDYKYKDSILRAYRIICPMLEIKPIL